MWPSKRPSARRGRSRFTLASVRRRSANAVRLSVSPVSSQVKPSPSTATAVRQQPSTAIEPPRSRPSTTRPAATRTTRRPPRRSADSTRPTSSTMPVNIYAILPRPAARSDSTSVARFSRPGAATRTRSIRGGGFTSLPRKTRAGGLGGAPLAPPGSMRIPDVEQSVVRRGRRGGVAIAAEERASAREAQGFGHAGRPMATEGGPAVPPAQQQRGPEESDLVEQPRGEERAQQLGATLDHDAPQTAPAQLGEGPRQRDAARAARGHHHGHAAGLEPAAPAGVRPQAEDPHRRAPGRARQPAVRRQAQARV